jgi:folate-binding protein YgfZ
MQLDFPFSHGELAQVRTGALIVPEEAAVFRVEGPGALDCLQGLLTCDLVRAGDASVSYGAILTPKGMIILDPWVFRVEGVLTLLLPPGAREPAVQHLKRVLPPRLARVTDLSDEWSAAWLLGGERARDTWEAASGAAAPAPGTLSHPERFAGLHAGGGTPAAPFQVVLLGPRQAVAAAGAAFGACGGVAAGEAALAAARVLAGWPTLGREIDDKTLPQEVRYDELGAVSYAKGCYTGQETVARVHFRGQVNRLLRGVELTAGAEPGDRVLTEGGKPRGTLRTTLRLEDGILGLASVRRESEPGTRLQLGPHDARVVALPFAALVAG